MARKTTTSRTRRLKPTVPATPVRAARTTTKVQPIDREPAADAGLAPFVCNGFAELRRRASGRTTNAVGDALTRLEADFRGLLGTG